MLRPKKDILASGHEVPLLKGRSIECFHTCDRVDFRDNFDLKLFGGGALSDHRFICDRLHRLLHTRQPRPRSEITQAEQCLIKILSYLLLILFFLIIYTFAACAASFQKPYIFSLTYLCILNRRELVAF